MIERTLSMVRYVGHLGFFEYFDFLLIKKYTYASPNFIHRIENLEKTSYTLEADQ